MVDHNKSTSVVGARDGGRSRRKYLKLAGASALVVGGLGLVGSSDEIVSMGGLVEESQWTLAFESTFDGESLDTDHWGVGWGWGRNTTTSPTRIVPENVTVEDGKLKLRGTHDGTDVLSGTVNTADKVTFGPGSYMEAKIKFAGREGFHNAFWSKPNSEKWPPEIDIVEIWQDGSGWDDRHLSRHVVHYSQSTIPGDNSTERSIGTEYEPGGDLTKRFHVYGAEWQPDYISYYVDGTEVARFTNETMLNAMQRGAPFYLMASLNISNIGTADLSQSWGEEMVLDWVRVWEYTPTNEN
jgi:beta-glucanase (GH16 family)